jgi:hypothetical protein
VGSECFLDFRKDNEVKIIEIVFNYSKKMFNQVDYNLDEDERNKYKQYYSDYKTKWKNLSINGIDRLDYVNNILGSIANTLPGFNIENSKFVNNIISDLSTRQICDWIKINKNETNDCFWVKESPCYVQMSYFCPIEYTFEFIDVYKNIFLKKWNKNEFKFNQLFEFRFVSIKDSKPFLFDIPYGDYVILEVTILSGTFKNWINKALYEVEQAWKTIKMENSEEYVKIYPHIVKSWGFYKDKNKNYECFNKDEFSLLKQNLITQEKLDEFEIIRKEKDPNGILLTSMSSWLINK